jgi:hypothetical protein
VVCLLQRRTHRHVHQYPDVNQYFKHFNGKFGLLEKLRLLWMKKRGTNKRLTGLAFGVVPKYQALGIDSFMIYECGLLVQNKGWYTQYEMGWAGDWNPKMINIYKSLNGVQSRRMITFRYLFDRNKPFERIRKWNTNKPSELTRVSVSLC